MIAAKRNLFLTIAFSAVTIIAGILLIVFGNAIIHSAVTSIPDTASQPITDASGYAAVFGVASAGMQGIMGLVVKVVATIMIPYGIAILIFGLIAKAVHYNSEDRILAYRIWYGFVLLIMMAPLPFAVGITCFSSSYIAIFITMLASIILCTILSILIGINTYSDKIKIFD